MSCCSNLQSTHAIHAWIWGHTHNLFLGLFPLGWGLRLWDSPFRKGFVSTSHSSIRYDSILLIWRFSSWHLNLFIQYSSYFFRHPPSHFLLLLYTLALAPLYSPYLECKYVGIGCTPYLIPDFGYSVEILMFYSCVWPRNNLWNFTKYIFDNVQNTSDSFPPLNLTEMVGCNKFLLDDIGVLDVVGTQM